MNLPDAYFAGFIDGEGYISVARYGDHGRPRYRLMLNVSQVDPRPLEALASRFGGQVKVNRARVANRSLVYYWQVFGATAEQVVRAVLPWLIVKREEAELALQYRALVRPRDYRRPHGSMGNAPLSDDEREAREAIVESIEALRARRRAARAA